MKVRLSYSVVRSRKNDELYDVYSDGEIIWNIAMKIMQRLRSPLFVAAINKRVEWGPSLALRSGIYESTFALNIHGVFAYAIGDRCSVSRYLLTGERILSHVNGTRIIPDANLSRLLLSFQIYSRKTALCALIIAISFPSRTIDLSIIPKSIFKTPEFTVKYCTRSPLFLFCYFNKFNFYITLYNPQYIKSLAKNCIRLIFTCLYFSFMRL